MQIKRWFMGRGGVRAAWRFAAFVALWYGGGYLVFPVLGLFHSFTDTGFTPGDILAYEVGQTVLMLLISLLLAGLEKHGPAWFGLSSGRDALKQFGWGALFGFGMVTLVLLACWATGHASVEGFAEHGTGLGSYLLIWLGGMLLVGASEELTFRGYALRSLMGGIGFWPAALLLSLLFGAEHLSKPMENVPDILNIVLLGLALSYSVRQTGAIWLAMGFHAAFDFFALSFYGSPNTGNNGLPLEHRILATHIEGPAWLTGGPQGLEASWLIPPLTLALCWIIRHFYSQTRFGTEAK
jgi:membrane protease YdiL (CAAX protease family)